MRAAQRSRAAAHTPCADKGAMRARAMLQLWLIFASCCALYQAQCSSDAAVVAGAGEAAVRVAIAHQIRLNAAPPADVIPIWSQVLLDCHLQPTAFVVHWEVELHDALSKRLCTNHSCPASHSPTAGESLPVSCLYKRSVLTPCNASRMLSFIGKAHDITCNDKLMSAGLRSGVQGWVQPPVVALESPREDLCCACGPAVDKDDHRFGCELRRLRREHL